MVGPETEMPVADEEMLDFTTILIAGRIVAKLAGMIGNLEKQRDDFFLLGFGQPKKE